MKKAAIFFMSLLLSTLALLATFYSIEYIMSFTYYFFDFKSQNIHAFVGLIIYLFLIYISAYLITKFTKAPAFPLACLCYSVFFVYYANSKNFDPESHVEWCFLLALTYIPFVLSNHATQLGLKSA